MSGRGSAEKGKESNKEKETKNGEEEGVKGVLHYGSSLYAHSSLSTPM